MTNAQLLPRLPWWAAVASAALGGVLLDLAHPGVGAWPLVLPGVALILGSWWHQSVRVAMLTGLVAGAAFWFPLLSWLTLYLGPLPWIGLAGLMAAWFVAQGAATAIATRGLGTIGERYPRVPVAGRVGAQAIAAAGIWALREGAQGSMPYGGFPWGRVAHVFADSPLGALVSWVGVTGLSATMVALCAVVVATLALPASRKRPHNVDARTDPAPRRAGFSRTVPGLVAAAGAAVVLAGMAWVPPAALEQTGSLRVAAIQGNSRSGIFDDRESGDVYADHVRGTTELLDELESSGESVDVIVWPENSAEFALTDTPLRGREVALLSARAHAPIVVGSVLANADGTYTNSSLVWGPTGLESSDAGTRYDKRFPVPFAEYMPNRAFFRALAPELVDLVQLEYAPGEHEPVHGVPALGREVVAGVAICFDIIFDDQAERMVDDGAEVIFAPTNNADFGRTDESVQQLQIARLRAIETGRALVNVSTVGTSRIVAPDGRDLDGLEPFTRGAMVATVPLVEGETPALRYGALHSALWMLGGGLGLFAGSWALLRRPAAGAQEL